MIVARLFSLTTLRNRSVVYRVQMGGGGYGNLLGEVRLRSKTLQPQCIRLH